MSVFYVSPDGSGLADGSSVANAAPASALASLIAAAGPDGKVLMLADQGVYTLTGSAIVLTGGGTDGHPVTVSGIDASGNAMRAEFVGTRADPFDPAGFYGEQGFRLVNGADNLVFKDLSFTNMGYGAFRVGGDVRNLVIENIDATNVQRFFEDYVTGTNSTATITGLTVRNVTVDGYSRGAIRIGYDSSNVLIDNVHGDSQRQDETGSTFAIGVHIEGSAHNITIQNSSMRNAEDPLSGSFWNGDGFATESGAYDIHFIDTVSTGNADAGFDIKSKLTTFNNTISIDNGRNYRIWANDTVLTDITSVDPNLRGGNSSQNHVWFNRGAAATFYNPVVSDNVSTTAFSLTEGSVTATIYNLTAMIGPSATLYKVLSKSVFKVDHVDYGAAVMTGASFADAATGVAVYADGAGDHAIVGSAFNDVIRGGGGSDILSGGNGFDRLIGGAGNDVLIGGAGPDQLIGGAGFDFASYAGSVAGVTVSLGGAKPSGGDAAGDLLEGVEGLIGSDLADTLTGDLGANVLIGAGGDDTLDGAGGDDTLIGGAGADHLVGGAGFDTANYSDSAAAVQVDLTSGTATGGDAEGDTLVGIERLVGSDFDDVLIGGAGGTYFNGGAGADKLIGGAGFDVADYSSSLVGITLDLGAGTSEGGEATGDQLIDIDGVIGTDYADVIAGDRRDNRLEGGAGDDHLFGRGGDDVLVGGAGADQLVGGDGFDTVDYSTNTSGVVVDLAAGTASGGQADGDTLSGIEAVIGTAFNDRLTGNAADNVLVGGDGDDRLAGGAGADLLVGGAGVDTADYSGATAGITLDLAGGVTSGDAAGDVLDGIEIVIGTDSDDRLVAAGSVTTLIGGGGNDSLTGGEGDDRLIGGTGADAIDGGAGDNTIDFSGASGGVIVDLQLGVGLGGEALGDTYANIQRVVGSNGADMLIGSGQGSRLAGGAGADVLIGHSASDAADYSDSAVGVSVDLASGTGSGGDAAGDRLMGLGTLIGSAFDDTLTGDAGDNRFIGGLGADTITGGGGFDTADYSYSLVGMTVNLITGTASDGDVLSGITAVVGSAQNDVLTGDAGANTLTGGEGDDVLDGAGGSDTMVGGAGNDTYIVDSTGDAVVEEIDGGTDRVNTTLASYTLGSNVENLGFVGTGSFTGYGNALDNVFYGSAGSETFYGYDGNDKFQGSLGADTLVGGLGNNSIDYSKSKAAVTVNLVTNVNIGGDADGDLLYDMKTVSGSDYADTLTGDDNANLLYGRGGNDIIYGGGGNDRLDGAAGIDAMYGGSGDDLYIVDNVADTVVENADEGFDTVSTSLVSYILPPNVEGLGTSIFLPFTGIGNNLDNTISGGSNADFLYGYDGNDTLIGNGGADHLYGGAGNDTASYTGSLAAVQIDLSAGTAHGGDAEGDVLDSIESLTGSTFDDTLIGDGGNNFLNGYGGADYMNGGAGDDTYVVDDAGDVIVDSSGADTVRTALASYTLATGLENLIVTGTLDTEAIGNAAANALIGYTGNDTLRGMDGDDLLQGRGGADQLIGGSGIDTASYSLSGAGVTIDLAAHTAAGGDAEGDTFDSIESLTGSAYGDVLTGDAGANVLSGLAGDDRLSGGGGADVLSGGAGNDVLDGGAGSDVAQFSGARGQYAFSVQGGSLVVSDLRTGSPDGVDALSNIEALQFLGGFAKPVGAIEGTGGNDTLAATAAADTFFYDTALGLVTGTDSITSFGAGDRIVTTTRLAGVNASGIVKANGSDRFVLAGTADGSLASTGTVKLYAAGTNKMITQVKEIGTQTKDGVTYFVYAAATDASAAPGLTFDGPAAPTVAVTTAGGTLSEAMAATMVTFRFSSAPIGFTAADVTVAHGTLAGLAVSASDPTVYTAQFTAQDGYAGAGAIGVSAGSFTDAVGTAGAAGSASVAIDTLDPALVITAGQTTLATGQSTVLTFTFSEVPTGFSASDVTVESGTLGALVATGDPKVFTMSYTPANGIVDASMVVSVAAASYTDAVANAGLAASVSLSVDTAGTHYTGSAGADSFTAPSGANWTIDGLAGNDTLAGAGGSDAINGGDGNDVLTGGAGDDRLDGGVGVDTATFSGARGDYSFTLASGAVVVHDLRAGASDGTDTLVGIEQLSFAGGAPKPQGAIVGTYANDTLMGTAGADTFYFDTATGLAGGSDQIKSFGTGDRIVTTSAIYDDNNDGRIKANASDRFTLPGTSAGDGSESTGMLKVLYANGAAASSLTLVGTVTDHGVTHYVYGLTGDTSVTADLHFA